MEKRATKQKWYELQQPQHNYVHFLNSPKIIYPDIAKSPRFAMDEKGYYGSNTMYFIPSKDYYLLALLNSSVGNFYFQKTCAGLEGKSETYLRFFGQYLEGFPVRIIDSNNSEDNKHLNRIVKLAVRMPQLNKDVQRAKTSHKKEVIQRQIKATDKQIDKLVYKLYDLTENEIEIVEDRVIR